MKIKDFIEKLKTFDQDLPVWHNGEEQWQSFDIEDFDIEVSEGRYTDETNRDADGYYLCIG